MCLLWAKYIEGKVTEVERDRLKKVKRFDNNSKCIQEPKLAKFRGSRGRLWSCSYRQLFATSGKWWREHPANVVPQSRKTALALAPSMQIETP